MTGNTRIEPGKSETEKTMRPIQRLACHTSLHVQNAENVCKGSKLSDEDRGLNFMGVLMLVFHTKMCHDSVLLVFEEAHFISYFDI